MSYCCKRSNAACLHCYPPITPKPSSIAVYLRKCNNVVTALLTLLSQGNLIHVTLCPQVMTFFGCVRSLYVLSVAKWAILTEEVGLSMQSQSHNHWSLHVATIHPTVRHLPGISKSLDLFFFNFKTLHTVLCINITYIYI
jgi:hypothetical protein